jgi:hypothetical protein
MKYQKQLDSLRNRTYSRTEIVTLRKNVVAAVKRGDSDAKMLLDEIDVASPADDSVIFIGFCPGATFDNRQDIEWKDKGICTFTYLESEIQLERFAEIHPGDLIVLKKREQFGKTMKLYGHGRVRGIQYDESGNRYLAMNWSAQDRVIEVPLMACNSTIDVRTMAQVETAMPDSFWHWINEGLQT